jgi:hypothetical protein
LDALGFTTPTLGGRGNCGKNRVRAVMTFMCFAGTLFILFRPAPATQTYRRCIGTHCGGEP